MAIPYFAAPLCLDVRYHVDTYTHMLTHAHICTHMHACTHTHTHAQYAGTWVNGRREGVGELVFASYKYKGNFTGDQVYSSTNEHLRA